MRSIAGLLVLSVHGSESQSRGYPRDPRRDRSQAREGFPGGALAGVPGRGSSAEASGGRRSSRCRRMLPA
jgi:hypothetical protein